MLLSRFWYVVLALLLGFSAFVLYLATSMYNRAGTRSLSELLSSDSQVVSWYLKDDARQRSAQLITFALNSEVAKQLQKSSNSTDVPEKTRDSLLSVLKQVNAKVPRESGFDAVFAVDRHGRVVARLGFDQGVPDLNLGGYPVVADALHGYVRDDTLIMDRTYRVVARPVEFELGGAPVGAIVGARLIDDAFARELAERTGAAIAFYAKGQRTASAAPENFDASQLDQIVRDLGSLEEDKDYREKGRSSVRGVGKALSVQYARLLGEAWALGGGYAVARLPTRIESPLGFFTQADDKDKEKVNIAIVLLVALIAALVGGVLSVLEHTRPLAVFRREAQRLAKGETDQLQPSKFRGVYRKIAADLNDGIDKAAAKGGNSTRAADLSEVLGDLGGQPAMSAFSFPGDSPDAAPASGMAAPLPGVPGRPPLPVAPPTPVITHTDSGPPQHPGMPQAADAPRRPPPAPRRADAPANEEEEWRQVYQEFLATKEQCGEKTAGFTYQKFEQTLRKNKESLVSRHGALRVKFSVYVKDGRASLKASPLRE